VLTHRYFRLRTLGELTLSAAVGDAETTTTARPRHLAVLAALTLSDRPIPRDSLLEMFWGGETEARARHSLSNALSSLRAILGADAIAARRDHVSLSENVRLEVDARQFTAACIVRDDALATNLYRGEFLRGIHVADARQFDAWASQNRARLERQFIEVCEHRVPALLDACRWSEATPLAERWFATAPISEAALLALLQAESGAGTQRAISQALDAFDRARRLLRDEYDVRPTPSVIEAANAIRDRLAPSFSASKAVDEVSVIPAALDSPIPNAQPLPVSRTRSRRISWWASGIAATLIVAGVWALRRSPVGAAESKRPIVAVTAINDVRGDTSISWLQAGLPRMIATNLDAMGGIEIVAPSRVRDVVVRLAGSPTARLTDE
jgi:DNA-binding SARP family transcriptional activator